jgi:hypothetical protein
VCTPLLLYLVLFCFRSVWIANLTTLFQLFVSQFFYRFWADHPWEAYRGRTVVEFDTLQKLRYEGKKTTDLREWTRVPSGDE